MAKASRQRERDLLVEAHEVEALSLECAECGSRLEIPWDGGEVRPGAACPCCGEGVAHLAMIGAYLRLFREATTVRGVRFRVRLLRDLP